MHNKKLYIIENLTSLHVGSGDTNFGVIDNLVQRDIITSYPTIHSSSLKGALKEFMNHILDYPINRKEDDEKYDKKEQERYNRIKYIFGDENQAGMVRFIEAHLLAVPMRADLNPYYLCVSPQSIETYLDMAKAFGISVDSDALQQVADYEGKDILVKNGTPTIEDTKAKSDTSFPWEALKKLLGEPVAIVPNTIFESLLDDLPVIARNQLENGESKNLFYEEVLPRKSKLFTIISFPTYLNSENRAQLQNSFDKFHQSLIGDELIQIGANASIGYGVTRFTEVYNA